MLLKSLKSKIFPFKNVIDKNLDWYMAQFLKENNFKLDKEIVQNVINVANNNADKHIKCKEIILKI